MREWSYNGGRSVWTYNKSERFNTEHPEQSAWIIESHPTKKIYSIDNFHDLKAGSLFLPEDAKQELFGFLLQFDIELDGNKLNLVDDFYKNYPRINEWKIRIPQGDPYQ